MAQGESRSAAEMVAKAKARIENPTPEQTAPEIEGGEAVLIDIREENERTESGTIPPTYSAAPRGAKRARAMTTSAPATTPVVSGPRAWLRTVPAANPKASREPAR